jgi:arginase
MDAQQLMQSGVAARVQAALSPRAAEADGWYIHLDLDVAGPEELPGGMTPAPHWPPR